MIHDTALENHTIVRDKRLRDHAEIFTTLCGRFCEANVGKVLYVTVETHRVEDAADRRTLHATLRELTSTLGRVSFPFPLTPDPTLEAHALRSQLEAMLAMWDSAPACDESEEPTTSETHPLRTVVTGPTGSGKSTVINTLLGAALTPAGVIRPTTTAPIALCHPAARPDAAHAALLTPSCRILPTAEAPEQMMLIDLPDPVVNDIDLLPVLASADQWLFVTTAARYADADAWKALAQAYQRGTEIAILLNRVPAHAVDEIREHLVEMLAGREMESVSLFILTDTLIENEQFLEEPLDGVRRWLEHAHTDTSTQNRTLAAVETLWPRLETLATATQHQLECERTLRSALRGPFTVALTTLEEQISAGAALRGDALAAWREVLAAGDVRRLAESRAGSWDWVLASWFGSTQPERAQIVTRRILDSVSAILSAALLHAHEQVTSAWGDTEAGATLLDGVDNTHAEVREHTRNVIETWHQWVRERVRHTQGSRAANAEATHAAGVAVTLVNAVVSEEKIIELDARLSSVVTEARHELMVRIAECVRDSEYKFERHISNALDATAVREVPSKLRAAAMLVESTRRSVWEMSEENTEKEAVGA